MPGTGSHMIWKGKPRTGRKKGSRAQGTGNHVIGEGKPRRERGLRVQSPNQAPGELGSDKEDAMLETKNFYSMLQMGTWTRPQTWSPKSKWLTVGDLGPREEEEAL